VPASDDNLHLEIGHVLFMDIVGYSKLLIEEQKERLNQLTAIVLATAQDRHLRAVPHDDINGSDSRPGGRVSIVARGGNRGAAR
jgi:hypothetical protein